MTQPHLPEPSLRSATTCCECKQTTEPVPRVKNPSQRIAEYSATYLSDAELLSLVLRHGNAQPAARELLAKAGSLKRLAQMSMTELTKLKGVGQASACALKASFGLASRLLLPDPLSPALETPSAVAELMRGHFVGKVQEEFHVLLLNTKHRLIKDCLITVGLLDRSPIHAREVFREAVKESCARIILVHNHPSGDPTPSQQDLKSTSGLVKAGKTIGIEVLDHVIIGAPPTSCVRDYLSLREEGLLK